MSDQRLPVTYEHAFTTSHAIIKSLTKQFQNPWYCVREMTQNSMDAGAQNIIVTLLYDCKSEQARIAFEDDGKGMDLVALRDGYLSAFGSMKPWEGEASTVGRFGIGTISLGALAPLWLSITTRMAGGPKLYAVLPQGFFGRGWIEELAGGVEEPGTIVAFGLPCPSRSALGEIERAVTEALDKTSAFARPMIRLRIAGQGERADEEIVISRRFDQLGPGSTVAAFTAEGRLVCAAARPGTGLVHIFTGGLLVTSNGTSPFRSADGKVIPVTGLEIFVDAPWDLSMGRGAIDTETALNHALLRRTLEVLLPEFLEAIVGRLPEPRRMDSPMDSHPFVDSYFGALSMLWCAERHDLVPEAARERRIFKTLDGRSHALSSLERLRANGRIAYSERLSQASYAQVKDAGVACVIVDLDATPGRLLSDFLRTHLRGARWVPGQVLFASHDTESEGDIASEIARLLGRACWAQFDQEDDSKGDTPRVLVPASDREEIWERLRRVTFGDFRDAAGELVLTSGAFKSQSGALVVNTCHPTIRRLFQETRAGRMNARLASLLVVEFLFREGVLGSTETSEFLKLEVCDRILRGLAGEKRESS